MPITSGRGTNCPYCSTAYYWTEVATDYETLKKEAPESPIVLDEGVDVGRWSERRDIEVNKVFPIRCPSCQNIYIARLGILNAEEIRRKKQFYEFNPPTKAQMQLGGGVPKERWGYVGYNVADFCEQVRAIKNQFLRDAVVRRLYERGWRFIPLGGP